jgi:hypothetical protein
MKKRNDGRSRILFVGVVAALALTVFASGSEAGKRGQAQIPQALTETVISIPAVFCTSTGEVCSPAFTTSLLTQSLIEVQYTAAVTHCSDISVSISVDDGTPQQTAFLPAGASSTFLTFSGLTPGMHTIAVQAIGEVMGCNIGRTLSWAGTLHVRTDNLTFDTCMVDPTGELFKFDSVTGDYDFVDCRKNVMLTGQGVVSSNGCKAFLVDSGPNPKHPDRNVTVVANTCTKVSSATVQILGTGKTYVVNDQDTGGSSCACP